MGSIITRKTTTFLLGWSISHDLKASEASWVLQELKDSKVKKGKGRQISIWGTCRQCWPSADSRYNWPSSEPFLLKQRHCLPDSSCILGEVDHDGVEGVSVVDLPYIDNTGGRRTGILWSRVFLIQLNWPTCKCQNSLFGHGVNANRIALVKCTKLVFQTYLVSTCYWQTWADWLWWITSHPQPKTLSACRNLGCLAEQWEFYVRTQASKGLVLSWWMS